jgi:tetratricopeptide (TPR) repeat protein
LESANAHQRPALLSYGIFSPLVACNAHRLSASPGSSTSLKFGYTRRRTVRTTIPGQLAPAILNRSNGENFLLIVRANLKLFLLLAASWLCFAAESATAQDPPPAAPAQKPPEPKPKPNTDSAVKSADDQPTWDPLRAEKDLDVGKYYMKKGDIDAAIDRFEDATLAKPGYAIPFLYLGEAYEKKGKKKPAVKAYQRYLDLYPHAEDADKIRKKIEKLHKEIDKGKN